MLLEQYPQLYDIHFLDVSKLLTIPALTVQELVIIPCSRVSDNDDMLRPALSRGAAGRDGRVAEAVHLPVGKPQINQPGVCRHYRPLPVTFLDGVNPTYGYQQLSDWLQQRYMPWGPTCNRWCHWVTKSITTSCWPPFNSTPAVQNVLQLELVDAEGTP